MIGGILFEIFVKTLLVIPGTFVLWMSKGFKGSYKETLETSNWIVNSLIAGAIFSLIIILLVNMS